MRYHYLRGNASSGTIVKVDDTGKDIDRWRDGGEPEDALFTRDYAWVLPELQALVAEIEEFKDENLRLQGDLDRWILLATLHQGS